VKGNFALRREVWDLFREIVTQSFQDAAWFQRFLAIAKKLNEESNDGNRTIPALPISGCWFTRKPRHEKVHCDKNVCGATFLLSTYEGDGAILCTANENGSLQKYTLRKNTILGGTWANWAHCNSKVTCDHVVENRTSWTLYLDRRVFSSKYVCRTTTG
jgi:hypothetical protein